MATYDIGTRPELSVTFTDTAETPAEPGAVFAILVEPDGTETLLAAPTYGGVGVYSWTSETLTQAGQHTLRVYAGTDTIAATEVSFKVRATAFDAP